MSVSRSTLLTNVRRDLVCMDKDRHLPLISLCQTDQQLQAVLPAMILIHACETLSLLSFCLETSLVCQENSSGPCNDQAEAKLLYLLWQVWWQY